VVAALPKRRFDFGWAIVAVLFLCTAALLGTAIYGFIMIADSMARAHGWSETAAGGLVSAMWLIAPLALFCAPVIARFGPWKLIVAGLWLLALAFAALSLATEFWQVYALRIVMGLGKVAIMTSVPVVVLRWFNRRFGTAIAIIWAGGSAGGIVVAPLVENLDRTAGPQATTLALAAGIAAVACVAMVTARAERRRIATREAAVAAAPAGPTPVASAEHDRRPGWPVIAGIIVATVALGCANVAFLALNPQLFARFAIDTPTIALIVGLNAAAATIGALAIGWLTDRFGTGWPGAAVGLIYLIGIAAYLSLTAASAVPLAMLAALLGGIGGGAAEVLWMTLLRREASGTHFAAVYGAWYFAIQVGYAAGGLVGGWALADLGYTSFVVLAAFAFALTPLFSTWRSFRGSKPDLAEHTLNT
jgi:predicted MFS family arabinose efflux permease